MAAPKIPKFASDINLDVPKDQMLAESAYALKHVGNHLIYHLWIGRTLVAAQDELAERGVNEQSGLYSGEMSRWLKAHQPQLADEKYKNLRPAAIWCIRNWANVQPYIKHLERDEPDVYQDIGARALRDRVEKTMSNIDKKLPKAPKEKPYNYGDGAWRAMAKHGLTFDKASETFVVADEALFLSWARHVLGRAILRDTGADPEAESNDTPPAPAPEAPPPSAPPDSRYRRHLAPRPKAAQPDDRPDSSDREGPF
jgi:hypothetical protein